MTVATSEPSALAEPRPVCPRCSGSVSVLDWYCPECGGPVGAYTTYLPYEGIRADAEFLARAARVSCEGDGLSWPLRVLLLLLILLLAPVVLFALPFLLLGRRRRGS